LEKGALRSMTLQDVKSCNFSKPLAVIESEIKTGIETRSVMKRISKENIREKGIELARTSHNNPLVVFSYILQQIESYDNMILMMVDTFAYVTALGLDVIGYCLLLSLGGGDDGSGKRSRTKSKFFGMLLVLALLVVSYNILKQSQLVA
jgi:THO complex subunit 2